MRARKSSQIPLKRVEEAKPAVKALENEIILEKEEISNKSKKKKNLLKDSLEKESED